MSITNRDLSDYDFGQLDAILAVGEDGAVPLGSRPEELRPRRGNAMELLTGMLALVGPKMQDNEASPQ
jgi:hypothetical protein